jgi:hypothetical protein
MSEKVVHLIELSTSNFVDNVLLERYLRISFNDVQAAFGLLQNGLDMRAKAPYLFTERDVMSPEIQTALTTL